MLLPTNEYGGYRGDVRQMRSTTKRIVEHRHVATSQRKSIEGCPHRHRHRPKMDGHVITHRDHFTMGVEERTGIIPTLFYVRRKRSSPKCGAHFFRDGVENTLEYFEFNDVDTHRKEVYREREFKIDCRKMKIVIDMQFN